MKITFCNTIKSWGGGEKWHQETAKELAALGHDVSFILHKESQIALKLNGSTVKQIHAKISNLTFLNLIKQLHFFIILIKIKPDAIIFNRPGELKSVALAARLAGVKKIVYRRGSDVRVKNNPLNKFFLEKIATDIIANSDATKASLLESGMNIQSKITIINNGIKVPEQEPSTKAFDAPVIVGTAGRLVNQKGFDMLIESANILKKHHVNFQIHIAGEGSDREKLEELIKLYQLEKHIVLKGFVSKMPDFFKSCDIFVSPSRYEGFGYVMVEAMLAKKPVIAYQISSAVEIIEEGKTGLLVEAFNVEQFANKIEQLISQPDLAMQMGQRGYNRAKTKFNMDTSLNALTKLLR